MIFNFFIVRLHWNHNCAIMTAMKEPWSKAKAKKHIKAVYWMMILSGIYTMVFSCKLFIDMKVSAFIIPYVFHILAFFLGMVKIYIGFALKNLKPWAPGVTLLSVIINIMFDFYFDVIEFGIMFGLLFYFIYVLRNSQAGWLFRKSFADSRES